MPTLLDILAKVGSGDTTHGAAAFVCVSTNEKCLVVWSMPKENPLKDKSYRFAIRIVRLAQHLQKEHKEFVLSRQILKSGTAIGALIREAEFAQSKPDFISKMNISLKEANETEYWTCLLKDTDYIHQKLFEPTFRTLSVVLV